MSKKQHFSGPKVNKLLFLKLKNNNCIKTKYTCCISNLTPYFVKNSNHLIPGYLFLSEEALINQQSLHTTNLLDKNRLFSFVFPDAIRTVNEMYSIKL